MNTNKAIEFFLDTGAGISGAVVGSVVGGAVVGPLGGIVGAISGTVFEKVITKIGTEINEQILSKRENKKVGATATYALLKIKENLESGKTIREDNFFQEDITERSPADEIMEGVLFAAQKEHEEKKLIYYGNLLANISFDNNITKEIANQLISIGDRLTFRQIKLLNLFAINNICPVPFLRQGNYIEAQGIDLISTLEDTYELYRIGLINGGGKVILEMGYINPSEIRIQGIGVLLYNLMELSRIPVDDMKEVIELLK